MYIPPNMLKVLHEDRVERLTQDMQQGMWFDRHPSLLMPFRLWTAEQLIRLGKWLKAQGAGCPDGVAADSTVSIV
jgi:hypothetical protein